MQNVDAISNLKMRLSWGNTGNTAIGTYSTLGAFSKYPYVMGIGEESAIGYLPIRVSESRSGLESVPKNIISAWISASLGIELKVQLICIVGIPMIC